MLVGYWEKHSGINTVINILSNDFFLIREREPWWLGFEFSNFNNLHRWLEFSSMYAYQSYNPKHAFDKKQKHKNFNFQKNLISFLTYST
jgi:hypothetical protein